jgi:16S rRNA (cytosine1402-N4)-methyltransferase
VELPASSPVHLPVLSGQVVALLAPAAPGLLVDATVGLGGHAAALLAACPGFRLLGLDRDPSAIDLARGRLHQFADRVTLENRPFSDLPQALAEHDEPSAAAVLADLGCSSLQLDTPQRGFSFARDGPLDMRMGGTGPTAADIVNTAEPEELMRILWDYGEERHARSIVRAIIKQRRQRPLQTTTELGQLVLEVLGHRGKEKIHPATRTFQALRIAVNDELGQLRDFVEPAVRCLQPGGRLAVISFHSLEDRIVKHTLRSFEGRCSCPPGLPQCVCNPRRMVQVLTRRPVRPEADEVASNPRARSARLRAVERLADPQEHKK